MGIIDRASQKQRRRARAQEDQDQDQGNGSSGGRPTSGPGSVPAFVTARGWDHGGWESEADREAATASSRARFEDLVGPAPQCSPGDRDAARAYLDRIEAALAEGGWTPGTRVRLHRLRTKWRSRASGRDIRFEVMGNASRFATEEERARMRMLSDLSDMKEIISGS